jgi:hypothetical protein
VSTPDLLKNALPSSSVSLRSSASKSTIMSNSLAMPVPRSGGRVLPGGA